MTMAVGGKERDLIDTRLLALLERLRVVSRYRLAGHLPGAQRSSRHGDTVDFADFREYHPGDDFRRIDYHVLARLDTMLVKLFEADDDLTVRVLLDASASMALHGKFEQARRLVAAVGAVALTSNDRVVLHVFPDGGPPRRFRGRNALPEFTRHLHALSPRGTTPFVRAAGAVLAATGPPGLTVVVSDLLTPDWHRAVTRLRGRGADLLVVHVLAPEETDPTFLGDLVLVDTETAELVTVSLSPPLLDDYRAQLGRWLDRVAARCREVGGTYLPMSTQDDIGKLLVRQWQRAGVLR